MQLVSDLQSIAGSSTVNLDLNANETTDVKAPLYKEIKAFTTREKFLKDFNVGQFLEPSLLKMQLFNFFGSRIIKILLKTANEFI